MCVSYPIADCDRRHDVFLTLASRHHARVLLDLLCLYLQLLAHFLFCPVAVAVEAPYFLLVVVATASFDFGHNADPTNHLLAVDISQIKQILTLKCYD